MCLTNEKDLPIDFDTTKLRIGYKLYAVKNSRGYHFIYGYKKPHCWSSARNIYDGGGFYIITNKRHAILHAQHNGYILCEVQYKNVIKYGYQYSLECHIAKNMKIIKEIINKDGKEVSRIRKGCSKGKSKPKK